MENVTKLGILGTTSRSILKQILLLSEQKYRFLSRISPLLPSSSESENVIHFLARSPPFFERTLEIKLKRRRSSYKFQVSWRMSIADSRRRLEFPETETSCRIRPISNARETCRDVGNLQWNGIKRDVYVKRGLLGRNVYRNDAEISRRISSDGGRRK